MFLLFTNKTFLQLFVSYTDLLETRERRQRHLQKYYLFSCTCERCSCDFVGSLDERLIQAAAGMSFNLRRAFKMDGRFFILGLCGVFIELHIFSNLV